jgi:hypothetical protein
METPTLRKTGDLTKFDAEKQAKVIHASEAALKLALKQANDIKDISRFEDALEYNLRAKQTAGREYAARFEHGGDHKSDQVKLSFDLKNRLQFCKTLGFSDQTIRKWVKNNTKTSVGFLLPGVDADKYAAKKITVQR